jgi:hypothetical protein
MKGKLTMIGDYIEACSECGVRTRHCHDGPHCRHCDACGWCGYAETRRKAPKAFTVKLGPTLYLQRPDHWRF